MPLSRNQRSSAQALPGEEQRVWLSSTSPSAQATRKDTRKGFNKKAAAWRSLRLRRWAIWLLGGRGRHRCTRLNAQSKRLPQSRRPTLAPGTHTEIPITGGSGTHLVQCSQQGELERPSQAGHGFHHEPNAASDQCCGRFGALLAAMGEGSVPGLDDGEHCGLAGPELLVKQMETWLPHSLDAGRMPSSLPTRRTGESCCHDLHSKRSTMFARHTKSTAGLVHDCINLKATLQLYCELRERFIDLLMAFEAKLVKPLCWAHMMVLRPKPSGGHPTIGLTVAPLRVLSRSRRPLAQKWEHQHDAAYFWGCQGKACDRAAWAHSTMVAAAKGRQQSAASLLLDLAKFYGHVGHDLLWEERSQNKLPKAIAGLLVRLADKCATFRDHSPRLQ